jgi:hypothetical protein
LLCFEPDIGKNGSEGQTDGNNESKPHCGSAGEEISV